MREKELEKHEEENAERTRQVRGAVDLALLKRGEGRVWIGPCMEHKHFDQVLGWDDWAVSEYSLSRSDSRSIKDAGSGMQNTQARGSALGIDFVGFRDEERSP